MTRNYLIIALIFIAQGLFAQVAKLGPVSDLKNLGIRNLIFSALVKESEAFVVEIDTISEAPAQYLRKIYLRPLSGVKTASLEVPILETQQFFAPNENNRIIIRMPYGTVCHESAGLEGQLGGKEFSFTIKEWKKDIHREVATTYKFNLSVLPLSGLPESARNIQPGSTFITAEKKEARP